MREGSFLVAEKKGKGEMKMKTKAIAAIMATMLLVIMVFYVLPVRAQSVIKIGVIGPIGWPQFNGMAEGAIIAQDWINDMGANGGGGITIGTTDYTVELHFANEHAAEVPPRPDLGAAEMKDLITVDECDFVIGGFRTECTKALKEEAMLWDNIYTIAGSATNELIDCGDGTCGTCVRCDYATYKYLFRATPINNTMLVYNIMGFLQGYVLPYRLEPLYGDPDPYVSVPVKTAVIAEDLDWTVALYNAFVYGGWLGAQAQIVTSSCARTPYPTTDFSSYLAQMHTDEIRLVVQIYSGPCSTYLVPQMAAYGYPKAVLCGIDVVSQTTEIWDATGGAVQYESFLHSAGTRSPLSSASEPYTTTEFWDIYYAHDPVSHPDIAFNLFATPHAPVYTCWGVYSSLITLHNRLEAAQIAPPFNQNSGGRADAFIPILEQSERETALGIFKYTGLGPHANLTEADYATHTITVGPNAGKNYLQVNPTMKGVTHDVFSLEYGSDWPLGYVRSHWTQWQTGRHEVVWPKDVAFSKVWSLPDGEGSMYPYPEDVLQDGYIELYDILTARNCYLAYPAAPTDPPYVGPQGQIWQFVADAVSDNLIDVYDVLYMRAHYHWTVELPLAYCDEAGKINPPT